MAHLTRVTRIAATHLHHYLKFHIYYMMQHSFYPQAVRMWKVFAGFALSQSTNAFKQKVGQVGHTCAPSPNNSNKHEIPIHPFLRDLHGFPHKRSLMRKLFSWHVVRKGIAITSISPATETTLPKAHVSCGVRSWQNCDWVVNSTKLQLG